MVKRGLTFQSDGLSELTSRPESLHQLDEVEALHARIVNIYRHVNMDVSAQHSAPEDTDVAQSTRREFA